jgi:hypothetical protein
MRRQFTKGMRNMPEEMGGKDQKFLCDFSHLGYENSDPIMCSA